MLQLVTRRLYSRDDSFAMLSDFLRVNHNGVGHHGIVLILRLNCILWIPFSADCLIVILF